MAMALGLRKRRLHALGVEGLRLRGRDAAAIAAVVPVAEVAQPVSATMAPASNAVDAASSARILRLALQPDPMELRDVVINTMYSALSEAVTKVGLQLVRVCDVAADPAAAVMVFGAAPLPEGVPALRVLRADPLVVLHTDRERKRLLWERLQALGRGGGG